jgi:hypothetical protein
MTVQEMLLWVYVDSGEPSDLCPFDIPGDESTFNLTRLESQKLLLLLNAAYRRVATWRLRNGRQFYHQNLFCREYLRLRAPLLSDVLAATSDTITLVGLTLNTPRMFNKWLVRVTEGPGLGEEKFVINSVVDTGNSLLTLDSDWEVTPDATSKVELVRNFVRLVSPDSTEPIDDYNMKLDPVSTLQDILKIRDMDNATDLQRVDNMDAFTSNVRVAGIPSQFKKFGQEIWFDTLVAENRTYEFLFIRQPEKLVEATQIPALTEPFHQAIVLWAVHDVQRRNQDLQGSFMTRKELTDLMETIYIQGSADMLMEQGGITVYG